MDGEIPRHLRVLIERTEDRIEAGDGTISAETATDFIEELREAYTKIAALSITRKRERDEILSSLEDTRDAVKDFMISNNPYPGIDP